MIRRVRELLMILLTVFLFAELIPVTSHAENRQYQVRIYAGNRGKISGGAEVFYDSFEYGESCHRPTVDVDDRYYVKGMKESGRDPSGKGSFFDSDIVDRDQDYIIVYGVKGNEVPYVVRYLEYGTNTVLAEEQTFYADVGDHPISSYIYIEGYQPYLRTTKTLVADESQNVLFAYYTAIPAPAAAAAGGGGGGGGAAAGGNANAGANANAGNGNAGANANANADNANANANTDNNANAAAGTDNNTAAPTQPTTPPQAYAQLEDIQDLDVPLASFEDIIGSTGSTGTTDSADEPTVGPGASATIQQNTRPKLLPKGLLIFFIVLFFCLIALLYWYLLFYRKKKKYADVEVVTFAEDEEEDDDFDIESFRSRHNKNKSDE